MAKHPRIFRRGEMWQFRVKVPPELIPVIGRRDIRYSLKTTDRREAISAERIESLRWDQRFEDARRQLEAGGSNGSGSAAAALSDIEIDRLAAIYLHDVMEEDEAARREGLDERSYRKMAESLDVVTLGGGHALARGDTTLVEFEVDDLLDRNGIRLDKGSEAYRKLSFAIMKTNQRAMEAKTERHAGKVVDTPPPPPAITAAVQGLTVAKLIEAYMAAPDRAGRSGKTQMSYTVIFRALKELLGENKPAREVTRQDCRDVRDVLMAMPPNATKRFPDMPIKDVAALATAKGLPVLSTTTVNSYLNNLAALFNWAIAEHYVDRSPALGLAPSRKKGKKKTKGSFTVDQLNSIFAAPLYAGCIDDKKKYAVPGPNRPRRGRFWVPLLMLYTGMRPNEACQLDTADIKLIQGVDCIIISPDPEGDDGESDKRVKTEAGERFVPVHPQLEALGFLDYVSKMRHRGERKLFPELTISANGYYSDNFSKWFGHFLRKAGAYTRRTTLHSLRHTYRDALREAAVGRDAVIALGGWAKASGEDDNYGDGLKARTLLKAIGRVGYEGLKLDHLRQNQPEVAEAQCVS